MNTPRLCPLRAVLVLFFACLTGLAPLSARGQFAALLDTTSRYAGNSTGSNVFNGNTGVATATTLNVPSYVVFDSLGNLYISDTQNNCVRKVDASGNVTTVAGLRVSGGADTCNTSTNPAPTSAEGLLQPTGLAIDSSNKLYIADSQHNCVRSLASGVVDSFASPALTTVAGTCSSVHTGSNTPLPDGLAVDSSSNLYISIVDSLYAIPVNQVVRHLASDPATTICAVAGQLSPDAANTLCTGVTGTVSLNRPADLAFDKNGNLFIADTGNNCVREVAGMTTQQTAVGQCANDLSGSSSTALNNPYGLAFSANASLYISESALSRNNVVSFNSGTNSLTLIAGLASGASGSYSSSQDGQSATLVPLNQPLGITSDTGGNIYLADSQNNIVRRMGTNLSFPATNVGSTSPNQTVVFGINQTVNLTVTVGTDFNLVSTTCNGSHASSTTCQVVLAFSPSRPGYRYSALQLRDSVGGHLLSVELQGLGLGPLSLLVPGVASTRASGLHTVIAVSTDSAGDAYVLEQGNGSTTADVLFYPAGGGAAQVVVAQGAGMVMPTAMAVDGAGNIFIADSGIAGGSIIRFGADGSVNTSYATGLPGVNSMAVDGFDDLFLAIGGSFHNVTEIYAGGTRHVVAGNGSVVAPNGVPAASAVFSDPSAIALGPNGIAIADAGTHYVYLIDNSGIIHIVVGNGSTSTSTPGLATGTALLTPDGLAIDAAGDIYIADDTANIVYAVYSNGTSIYPVVGTGTAGYTGDGGPSNAATLHAPLAIALDGSSNLFVVDSANNALREVTYPVTDTIGFGSVFIGTTSAPVLQYLANAGNANLAFSLFPFTTTNSHYAVSGSATTCTATVVLGGVCDIGYTFTPTAPPGPAPAGQSNLVSNSYNSQQTVLFSTSGSSGYATVPLPFALTNPETEVYGYSFSESWTFSGTLPASGTMVFYIGSQTLCTASISNASAGTITCNAPPSGLAVGSYTVNFTFTSTNSFYGSVTGTTTLNVTKAPMSVTPNNFTRQYGTVNPTFIGSIAGAVNGDAFAAAYSTTATQFSPVGTYPIAATLTAVGLASLGNYTVTYNVGTLTIVPYGSGGSGGLVVTENCTTRPYGRLNPTFTGTITGALNGDIFTVAYSTTATQFSPVGTYAITAVVSGAAAANYTITVVPCSLSVTPAGTGGSAGLVVTVNNASRQYGTPNPTFTSTVTGLLNGDSVTVTYSTTATQFSPVGNYAISATVSGAATANYTITVIPGTLTITQAPVPLTVTVNNTSRPYGQLNPTFTSTIAGLLNGDSVTVTYSTTATQFSPVGNYAIGATVSGASAANYVITVIPGTLSITQAGTGGTAGLTVAVNNASRPYGTPNPTFTGTVTGLLNGDTVTVTYSTTATIASPVGAYPVNAVITGPAAANYTVTVNPGTLTITPAATPLVVTVNNASRSYGTPNPTFTSTVTGLLNGDTVTVTYSTTATIASPVGAYSVNATVAGPAAANYAITVVPGTLTITPVAALMVTVNNLSRPYGTPNPTFTSTIAGAVNGDTFTVTCATTATALSDAGNYTITATVAGANIANYATVTVVPGTLAITPLATVTTVTTSASPGVLGTSVTFTAAVTYGAGVPVAAATVNFCTTATIPCTSTSSNYLGTGTLNASGVATYTTSTLPLGNFTIAATYQATLDFASSSGTVIQAVIPGTFTLSATPSNQFIRGPGTTVYLVTVSAVANFNGPVTLACSGLPADATCTFGTPTVNITSTGATSSVTTTMTVVNTVADARLTLPVLHTPMGRTPSGLAPIAFAAVFPFGLGAFFGLSRRKHGRKHAGRSPRFRLFVALLCTAAIVSLAGCACLSSVYQVYTIPITGTTTVSGVGAQSTAVSLTVAQQ